MPGVGQGGVQRPEHLDDAHGGLGDGLGGVAARGRDRADGGDGAAALVGAEALDHARALVELGETAGQVGGVALFAGHLLESAGHLTQGLGPAGGGVCQDGDVVAHVAEVLGYGDSRVDGGLAGRDGHVGGVRYEDGALHEGFAVAGVGQLGELHEDVRHLVAALAAADVDDDVHVGPLGELVLHDGLAGAEGAGDRGGAALGDGEERVYDALAAVHGPGGGVFLAVGPGDTDRPVLDHGELTGLAVVVLEDGDDVVHGELALFDGLDRPADPGGHQELVEDGAGLLDGAEDVARGDVLARLGDGDEVPLLLAVERRDLDAAGDGLAGEGADLGQGTLDTVVDVFQHTGAELHRQRQTRGDDLGAGAEARGLLIDLDGRGVSGHVEDLANEPLAADTDHVRHVCVGQALGHDQRAGYFRYNSAHLQTFFTKCLFPRPFRRPPSARPGRGPAGLLCRG